MAFLILPTGEKRDVEPADGKRFTLQELQAFVGGYIERLPLNKYESMLVNEDGKRLQLAVNHPATDYARLVLAASGRVMIALDVIVGPAFVFREGEVD